MTTTVRQWTGLEAKALRVALRMTMHEFADYLGVGTRTVAKWERAVVTSSQCPRLKPSWIRRWRRHPAMPRPVRRHGQRLRRQRD